MIARATPSRITIVYFKELFTADSSEAVAEVLQISKEFGAARPAAAK